MVALQAWLSTTLVSNGFRSAEAPIVGDNGFLEGYSDDPNVAAATATLGDQYELLKTAIKPYPCCRHMHTSMDAMLDIAASEDIHPDDVESITVRVTTPAYNITGNPTTTYPKSLVDAQFSLPFAMALTLREREASIDAFLDGVSDGVDPAIRGLIDRVTVTTADWIDDAYPDRWMGEVTVSTADESFEVLRKNAKGEPENPIGWDGAVEKFERLTATVLDPRATNDIRERIQDLENIAAGELVAPSKGIRAD
jgi:2-methylcitrate dehydratase PrpD